MQILNISLLNNINNNNILSVNNSIYRSHDYLVRIVKWIIIVIHYFINLYFLNINYNCMQWLKIVIIFAVYLSYPLIKMYNSNPNYWPTKL